MKVSLLILIFLVTSQQLRAGSDDSQKKKLEHHKGVRAHPAGRAIPKPRYKLMTYYKNGKKMHRYVDIHPKQDAISTIPELGDTLPSTHFSMTNEKDLISTNHKPEVAIRKETYKDTLETQDGHNATDSDLDKELDPVPPPDIN